jgi:hypothetical protein
MKKHLNTLFVTTQGPYLAKEGETVVVRDGKVSQAPGFLSTTIGGNLSVSAMFCAAQF